MPKTKDQKRQISQEISEKLQKSKTVVFTDYKGLTMAQLSDLRQKLAENGAELGVTKNTLLKFALEDQKLPVGDTTIIEGPTATLFAYEDEITPIKTLTKALKEYQTGSIKGGFLNGEFVDKVAVNKLAQLPSREELQAKVVGSLAAPLSGIVSVLNGNLRNLVYALDQIRISKGGE